MSTTFKIDKIDNEVLTINSISSSINLQLLIGRNSSITFESWVNKDSYDLQLNAVETFNIGIENESLRGVLLYYSKNSYFIKVNSPANENDWKLAITLIKFFIKNSKSEAYNIEEKKFYDSISIEKFNYMKEIHEGFYVIKNLIYDNLIPSIQGFNLKMLIDDQYVKNCLNSLNNFLIITTDIQWSAYTANPSYITKSNKLIAGYYVLSSNLDTYLPKVPIIPEDYETVDSDIEWIISFNDDYEGNLGAMNYQEFIKKNVNLDMVDANNFKISLSKDEMVKILKFRKIESRFIEIFNKNG
jgi:hypothetical protein